MGKVVRKINFEGKSIVDFLKTMYSINTDSMVNELVDNKNYYKNIELDSILVNVTHEENNILINKLVSLKAFLLSKEQGMDINDLLKNIDKVMKMSENGLKKAEEALLFDSELKLFLSNASIEVIDSNREKVTLSDGKRVVNVNLHNEKLDFNSIVEVEE